jgi:hypothetical protein
MLEDGSELSIAEELALSVPEDERKILMLDTVYDQLLPGSCVGIYRPKGNLPDQDSVLVTTVESVETVAVAKYGLSVKATRVTLESAWLTKEDVLLSDVRDVTIFAQPERMELAEQPIDKGVSGGSIQLNGYYDGLEAGRVLIVSGERTDIENTKDKWDAERVMIASVEHDVLPRPESSETSDGTEPEPLPGDRHHTTITLASELAYVYKRDTVTIYGNVVRATHGETREQILGSGDASQTRQTFSLAFKPLTFLAAPTARGAESTLVVRVNEVQWHESDNPASLGPDDLRLYTTTDEEDNVSVVFSGARIPTGVENVMAEYRQGIGPGGNVAAEQISLLSTKPLGVSKVINPMRASGGAGRDTACTIRRNAPIAVEALDRLVSVRDYADFARGFAAIGKADAQRMYVDDRQLVHLTIAGADNAVIDVGSDLYLNLLDALRRLGDPNISIEVAPRQLKLLVIVADVRVLPDYRWESVEPALRAALLETFSFDRRALGQSVYLSEVISTMQQVSGVDYVDVNVFQSVDENDVEPDKLRDLVGKLESGKAAPYVPAERAEVEKKLKVIRPAQLAFLDPALPDTLLLGEIKT